MKVLCKEEYFDWEKIFWTKNNLYEYEERCGAYPLHIISLESNYSPHLYEEGSMFYRNFSKYFYTPEETVNVLRTKLIDRILNE